MLYQKMSVLGENLSTLCLGTMNFGASMDEATSFGVMDAFVEMGGNFIDTARLYGEPDGVGAGASERVIGKWIRSRGNRSRICLATKGGHPPLNDMEHGRLSPKSLEEDLHSSLKDLGVAEIDLYWLHRDDEKLPVEEILYTLNGFVRAGKIRAIGASNWRPRRLEQAQTAARENGMMGFCADQPLWSLARNADQRDLDEKRMIQMDRALYAFHSASGCACVPYTSQAKGFFSKLMQGGEAALSPKARDRYLTRENLNLFAQVKEICAETGLSAGAVALAFLTGQPDFVTMPIAGVSRMEQMQSLREAGDAKLTKEQMKRLLDLCDLA